MSEDAKWEWRNEPPEEDGDFFYTGPLPDGNDVVLIVQTFTHPLTHERMALTVIPPGWRGDETITQPKLHFGTLDQWRGKWSGPEFGLCCASNNDNA